MAKINPHFDKLRREYIFPIIEQKLAELKARFPQASPINLGIGDVALPLAPTIVDAICEAVKEMGTTEGIHGYGPHNGYLFLRQAILEHEFAHLGRSVDEIFISDGINSDAVNLLELLSPDNVVGIMDPTYPAYLDASLIGGKKGIVFLSCLEENGFCPETPNEHCDILYICSPNNPTGVAMTKRQLTQWVDYALKEEALILFDHAYEPFITSPDAPKSIYEIEGADRCVIEMRSFSKGAGFTGLRCAYAVVPKTLLFEGKSLHALWDRRQAAKFNGVAYPIQQGALASYTPRGKEETKNQVQAYLLAAHRLKQGLTSAGYTCYGGVDSPYIWWKTPKGMSSWDFFDLLLNQFHLISIPGKGFGKSGEGYVRLSAFTTMDRIHIALNHIKTL